MPQGALILAPLELTSTNLNWENIIATKKMSIFRVSNDCDA